MIDKTLLKTVCFTSFITGGILGVFPLIPALTWIAWLLLMVAVAPFIIIYLNRLGLIDPSNTEQTLVISALTGAVAVFGFAVLYLPVAFILNLLFHIQSFIWIKVLFVNFGFLIPMLIFTSFLSALFNAFSGFITVYFYNIKKQ